MDTETHTAAHAIATKLAMSFSFKKLTATYEEAFDEITDRLSQDRQFDHVLYADLSDLAYEVVEEVANLKRNR